MARPQFELLEERESGPGWSWTAQVLHPGGSLSRHEIRLSWADYELWCEGRREPAAVAEAAYGYLLEHDAALAARDRVDLSWTRRVGEDADEVIPGLIR
jgi:hypothetical protein